MTRYFDQKDLAYMAHLLSIGVSRAELMRRYRVSRPVIERLFPPMPNRNKDGTLTDKAMDRIRAARLKGAESDQRIAERFGVPVEWVRNIRPAWSNETKFHDVGLSRKLPVSVIARIAKVPKTTIHARIKRGIRGEALLAGAHAKKEE